MKFRFRLEDIEQVARDCWNYFGEAPAITFQGSMGSGKTTLIRALCRVLGVKDTVSSPTFSIINQYQYLDSGGRVRIIHHLDLYRVRDLEEALRAGVEECLNSQGTSLVEWPELIVPLLPEGSVHLHLIVLPDQSRILEETEGTKDFFYL